jgi:sensory rhodopsin
MAQLIATIGPRIVIPGFFVGQKIRTMTDIGKIFQTVAFSAFFVTSVITAFQSSIWLSIIPGIAGLSYYSMLADPNNTQTYRYADWTITTPLMLAAILFANHSSLALILGLVILDLIMIGAGYLGVKEPDIKKKWLPFGVGCLALLPILYVLLHQKKHRAAIYLTVALWILYPLVWAIEEAQVATETIITCTYSVMDVLAKVGLVYLLQA